jgi:Na+-translocating ferredoxin:NAD+ oxidoreductase subunit E
MEKFNKMLKTSVIDENPTFVSFLALCPTLGTTTSLSNAFSMGLAATFVLILSNVSISCIRKLVPDEIRIPVYITIIATIVTLLEMLMKTYLPELYLNLGIFLPLIVVNCIILGRAEAFASKNNMFKSFQDAIVTGIAFTLSLSLLGAVREFLGTGGLMIFDVSLQVLPRDIMPMVFQTPVGAFIAFGMLSWFINEMKLKNKNKLKAKEA